MEPIVFLASVPTATAIRWYGDGNARVTFDVPKSEIESVKQLMNCDGKVLSVAVVVAEKVEDGHASEFYRD